MMVDRSRPVHKSLWLSEDEWAIIHNKMEIARMKSFSKYARKMLIDGEVKVDERAIDLVRLKAILAPMGNNLNQIARAVNASDFASQSQVDTATKILMHVSESVDRALG